MDYEEKKNMILKPTQTVYRKKSTQKTRKRILKTKRVTEDRTNSLQKNFQRKDKEGTMKTETKYRTTTNSLQKNNRRGRQEKKTIKTK